MKKLAAVLLVCLAAGSVNAANLVTNFSFETSETTSGGWPSSYGDWGGDYSAIVGSTGGIDPLSGSQMLQFKGTNFGDSSSATTSQVLQLVDISGYADLVASGTAIANLSAYFNRVAGDAQTDTIFDLDIMAYDGSVDTFASRWESYTYSSALAVAHLGPLYSDSSAQTWQQISGSLALPSATTFMAITVKAGEDVYNDSCYPEFDGHFVDCVSLEIIPEPCTIALLGLGVLGLVRRR